MILIWNKRHAIKNWIMVIFFNFFFISLLMGQGKPNQLEEILMAHKAEVGAIKTVACKVQLDIRRPEDDPKKLFQFCKGDYFSSPDTIRARGVEETGSFDFIWNNSVRKMITTIGDHSQANRMKIGSRFFHRCDPWFLGLLAVNLPGTIDRLPLGELLLKAEAPPKADFKKIDKKLFYVISIRFGKLAGLKNGAETTLEIHLDPSNNYLVRKANVAFVNGSRREEEVIQFKEYQPGHYFPEKVVSKSINQAGKVTATIESVFSNIQINQPLPEDSFQFQFPPGILMNDHLTNSKYQADEEGNPLSDPIHQPKENLVFPKKETKNPEPIKPLYPTKEEPVSWINWIFPGSLLIVVVGVAMMIFRSFIK